ncbi:hypothetical protein ES707_14486 [subsurface metagenome]
MDIIIDTNILRQDHLLRSHKFQVVLDYLQKTNSHLIIPTVVKNEMISIFRRELIELFNEAKNKAAKIDSWCYDNTPRIDFHLNIDKEVATYESFLNNLTQGGGALELPHQDKFLDEVIHRQINRIKPAGNKGEEFRDIVIWLSMKEFLRQSQKEAVFISQNIKQFAAKDSRELHPDLAAELSVESLHLRYFCSLDDFIQQHSSEVDFITKEWIKQAISQADIESVTSQVIESSERSWQRYSDRKGIDWTGYIGVVGIIDIEVDDFYVYELSEDNFYLHTSYFGEVEVEIEYEESRDLNRRIELKVVTVEVLLEIESKIHNQEIEDLRLESWDFA